MRVFTAVIVLELHQQTLEVQLVWTKYLQPCPWFAFPFETLEVFTLNLFMVAVATYVKVIAFCYLLMI